MTFNRVTRNEAWIVSLVVHAALLAGLIAMMGRPRESAPAIARGTDSGLDFGVITLVETGPRVTPAAVPAVLSGTAATVATPIQPPPLPSGQVRPASHQETTPAGNWVPAAPIARLPHDGSVASQEVSHPVVNASGSDTSSSGSVGAHAPGSPSSQLPAGAVTLFFDVPAVGKSVVFVLDRSASMGLAGRLDRARSELAASLRRLPASARFQVIAYNRSVEPVRIPGMTGLLGATPVTVEAVLAAVERMPAEGSTDHAAALTAALSLGPDVIYFLTDEDDLKLRDVQAVTRRNLGRACIHAICLTASPGETPMRVLARENRGVFQTAD
jgi:hypothetical protein